MIRFVNMHSELTRNKLTIKHSCSFVTSLSYQNKLVIVCKFKNRKTLEPYYIAYFNEDYVTVNEYDDVKIICEIRADIVDTVSMYKHFTRNLIAKNTDRVLVKEIMEKINEI